jgi:hypothetical protein
MRIKIGPYIKWWGPYQIADLLQKVGVSEKRCESIGEYFSHTKLNDLCEWIHSKRERKVSIHIDDFDVWNMNDTLAMIALPMLIKLKERKHGYALVDDEDVPESIRSTNAPPKENEYDMDAMAESRWEWVLNQIIWSFQQLHPDNDWEKQYESGVHDIIWVQSKDHPNCKEMQRGPNDTFKVDREGMEAHQQKIDNGMRLFGKYYGALWD